MVYSGVTNALRRKQNINAALIHAGLHRFVDFHHVPPNFHKPLAEPERSLSNPTMNRAPGQRSPDLSAGSRVGWPHWVRGDAAVRRRILRKFQLDEITAVDRPAQEHTRMALVKRDNSQEWDERRFEKVIGDEPLSFATFEDAVEQISKLHGGSLAQAMSRAASAYLRLLREYNEEGLERVEKAARGAADRRAPTSAERDWEWLVTGIMGRDGATRAAAMQSRAMLSDTIVCVRLAFSSFESPQAPAVT